MFAITGITGRVGGGAAQTLLAKGAKVRAVVRDAAKAKDLLTRGAEVAVADFNDADSLAKAFTGAEGVFIMVPPNFAPLPDFPETRAILEAVTTALKVAKPGKVVALSSIGGQHDHDLGLITQSHLLEEALKGVGLPTALLRPGWFMENNQYDLMEAQQTGEFHTFLFPLDRQVPMVATKDIGALAGETLLTNWEGIKVVELEGPKRYSPNDEAAVISSVIGKPVQAIPVPRDQWTAAFEAAGMPQGRTEPRAQMVESFNTGWVDYEFPGSERVYGSTTLEELFKELAAKG